jgi:hypothetical protein
MFLTCHVTNVRLALFITRRRRMDPFLLPDFWGKRCIFFTLGVLWAFIRSCSPSLTKARSLAFPVLEDVSDSVSTIRSLGRD